MKRYDGVEIRKNIKRNNIICNGDFYFPFYDIKSFNLEMAFLD